MTPFFGRPQMQRRWEPDITKTLTKTRELPRHLAIAPTNVRAWAIGITVVVNVVILVALVVSSSTLRPVRGKVNVVDNPVVMMDLAPLTVTGPKAGK